MEAKAIVSYGSFTSSTSHRPVLCPQELNKRGFFLLSFAVNSQRCSININLKNLSFCPKASLRGNLEATGIPTSVPVRVAHELLQAGHRYLDVRTPEEYSAGHAAGAINIPYMYRVGSVFKSGGQDREAFWLSVQILHVDRNKSRIIRMTMGCQLGKRSMMAATALLAAVSTSFLMADFSFRLRLASLHNGAVFALKMQAYCLVGFTAVTDIAGGFAAWTQNGLPTEN
ncbi:unnamed protein product [Dovyalis caffra]|uniref:Rhodanese domain-containing protein n=1 Tax=Dovyalis caffra TaxID=77055 RepID=A0AAV1SPN7_9ROSI|nr:unnamed protein product [Dovyalis caffra]